MGWCSANALDRVSRNGWRALYGWLVWEASGLYLNAEFHCVWQDGRDLYDITPTQEGETCVLSRARSAIRSGFRFHTAAPQPPPAFVRLGPTGEPLVRTKLAEVSGPRSHTECEGRKRKTSRSVRCSYRPFHATRWRC